ncbi:FAD-dependent monooxygenase [Kitasatospora sp. MAP5-34]|uniref:NAD(P)/FAD-dependent oxidoreductase n=1 Tax=Kitasatospora sp. MAP5-34 TaxID=3035102 RepID=UPI002474D33B|nr:FAD-dependent monooxygenase [Kitasatospora sp. MAP5-34]MDH6576171.1 flavin-dependent dehydrogenase [Kitasatospora sp. MAP5-34]
MTVEGGARGRGTAVVIGGGLAGTLAAWALRGHAERIVVVERDRYPEQPDFRAGLPQGRHAHLLLEAGHRVLEELMPGVRAELLAAGAVRVPIASELRWLSSAGWMAEFESEVAFLSCTRPVLDHAVLERVRGESSVEFLEGTDVVGLLGSARTVTGVRIRERGQSSGEVRELPAELVVDASGRSSALPSWLAELGCPPVPEERVDAGVAYSSRLYHRPAGLDLGFTALYLQTKGPDSPRLGVLLPVEGDRWIVSLGSMRGAEPEPGEAGFERHLGLLRDPSMRELLASAEPASDIRGFRPGPGVRRRYDRRSPEGLVVTGDAACTFNPVYGQGITVAAFGARALRAAVARQGGIGATAAAAARKGIAAVAKDAWVMSSSEDVRFPSTTGGPSGALVRAQHRYLDRVLARATTNPHVCAAFQDVMSLIAQPTALFHPSVLVPVLRGGSGGAVA